MMKERLLGKLWGGMRMSKERLEGINKLKNFINSLDDSADADDFHKFVDTCQINYEEGTFNEMLRFMQSQAERVKELERSNKQLKNNLSVYKGYYKNTLKINEDVIEENKKYRKLIKGMGHEIEVLTDIMSNADNADELNEEVIRLQGMRGYGNEVS